MNLDQLRNELNELDSALLTLVAKRQALSKEIATVKRASGYPTRDYQREREVLVRARAQAERLGISPSLAETLLRHLIDSSLTTQERAAVLAQGQGLGKRAVVIGGRGKMGRWFAEFLASQGYAVAVADPAGAVPGLSFIADWQRDALDQDVIVIATPLGITAQVLEELARRRPRGLIFDLGSLKTPLRVGLESLVRAGCRVTSLHPMFGPDTELLSGRHVILIDLGQPDALDAAQEIFASTMVERVVMSLDEHDRLIAYVLGLSHALNIAFFTALAASGEAAPRLAKLSSTTFDAQLDVAGKVAGESPALYFEIQSLNDYGLESLEALKRAVDSVYHSVKDRNAAQFAALMQQGKQYLDVRAAERER
jgi:chorismate mutase / prephenate dehydrogenase